MHIDLWALALQATNFVILAWLLHRFLYKPVTNVVAQRRALVQKDFEEAAQAKHAADVHRRGYEHRIAEIAEERERVISEARSHIEVERREVIEHAQTEARSVIAAQRRALADEKREIARDLGETAADLAVSLAERLLAQLGTPVITAALLERVCAHLASLPPERLADRGPVLQIATMPGLDEAAKAEWSRRLAPLVGAETELFFITDESLIAGAELRFPSMVVAYSWRDCLDEARAGMLAKG
ncbi:MAG: hypothetical protein WCJ64_15055 [Rhodospirillaceae bacterium]